MLPASVLQMGVMTTGLPMLSRPVAVKDWVAPTVTVTGLAQRRWQSMALVEQ
ncbi:MAG: hypothetical protein IPK16_30645 [Anaerolineales bacterium]|nr:hypothetical protein [Anaerolineales bacterium]